MSETSIHKGHFNLMPRVTEMGVTFLPPIPAFYFHPKTIDDLINQTAGKLLDLSGINHRLFERWGGPKVKETLKKKGVKN